MGLVTPWLVGSSWIRDHICDACIGRWTPNHWTTKEVPKIWLLKGVIEREKIEPIHPLRDPDKTLDWFLLLASLELFPDHPSALTPLVCESLHSLQISPFCYSGLPKLPRLTDKNLHSSSICVIFLKDSIYGIFFPWIVCWCACLCECMLVCETHVQIPRFHQHFYENLVFSN